MTGRIVIDPNICNGRPTVRGTRITAQTVLEFLAAGDSVFVWGLKGAYNYFKTQN